MAIQLDASQSEAWAQSGIASFLMNNLGDARSALNRAITLNPTDTNARRHLALVDLSEGDTAQAIEHFSAILRLSPEDDACKLELAVVMISLKRNSEARTLLDDVSPEYRQVPRYRYYDAILLRREHRDDCAFGILNELSQADNDYQARAGKLLEEIRQVHH